MKKLLLILILPLMIFTLTGCKNEYIKFIYHYVYKDAVYYFWYEDGIVVTDYEGNKKDIEIPSEIDGHKVVGIDERVVDRAVSKGALSFKIPDTVIRLFRQTTSLEPNYPVANIKKNYPNGVVPFLEIENGVTYVDGWVLEMDPYSYKDIVIKDGTRGIVDNVFAYNLVQYKKPTIESLYIPGSIKIIPRDCFRAGLPHLKTLTIGDGVERIEEASLVIGSFDFYDPIVYLPSSVNYIAYDAISHFIVKYLHITFRLDHKIEEIVRDYGHRVTLDDISLVEKDKIEGIYYDKEFTNEYDGKVQLKYNTTFYIKLKE